MPRQLDDAALAELTYIKGLCRLADGTTWVHVSARKGGRAVRRIEPGMPESNNEHVVGGQLYSIGEISELLPDLDVSTIKKDDFERWSTIRAALAQLLAEQATGTRNSINATTEPEAGARTVPRTALRHLYSVLRTFSTTDIHEAFAKYTAKGKGAKALGRLFVESANHLETCYRGIEDSLRIERPSDAAPNPSFVGGDFARDLVSYLKVQGTVSTAGGDLRYLAREVSTLRTPNAQWDDGRSARNSGAGGIDVLLTTAGGQSPIVAIGEVKATTDSNLFLALVQALTYASELVGSATQRRRLASSWPEHLGHLAATEGPWADVVLFHEPSGKEATFVRHVEHIARNLAENRDKGVGHWIRSIHLVRTRRTADGFDFDT